MNLRKNEVWECELVQNRLFFPASPPTATSNASRGTGAWAVSRKAYPVENPRGALVIFLTPWRKHTWARLLSPAARRQRLRKRVWQEEEGLVSEWQHLQSTATTTSRRDGRTAEMRKYGTTWRTIKGREKEREKQRMANKCMRKDKWNN